MVYSCFIIYFLLPVSAFSCVGSVSPKNSAELGALPDVDGFLVGGASLVGAQFKEIVTSLRKDAKL
jgi:triosephosphate isomerase